MNYFFILKLPKEPVILLDCFKNNLCTHSCNLFCPLGQHYEFLGSAYYTFSFKRMSNNLALQQKSNNALKRTILHESTQKSRFRISFKFLSSLLT